MYKWKHTTEEQRQKIAELFRVILVNNYELHPCDMPRTTYVLYKIHEKGYFIELDDVEDIIKRMGKNVTGNETTEHVLKYLQNACYGFYYYFHYAC